MTDGFLRFEVADGVHILVTTRDIAGQGKFGFNLAAHVEDHPVAVEENRKQLRDALPGNPVWINQIHSADVIEVEAVPAEVAVADGSVTPTKDLPLAILTADCLPIVLWSKESLAGVHAGWRGLGGGIIKNAAENLTGEINAWVGAGIGPCHYEVDEKVAREFNSLRAFESVDADHYRFNLQQEAVFQLKEVGVVEVTTFDVCTACDSRFYSHRRDAPTGRFATIAWRT